MSVASNRSRRSSRGPSPSYLSAHALARLQQQQDQPQQKLRDISQPASQSQSQQLPSPHKPATQTSARHTDLEFDEYSATHPLGAPVDSAAPNRSPVSSSTRAAALASNTVTSPRATVVRPQSVPSPARRPPLPASPAAVVRRSASLPDACLTVAHGLYTFESRADVSWCCLCR
jgi:hypothetical protein